MRPDPGTRTGSRRARRGGRACEARAAELGGEITCEFFDQESGAKDDRPAWTALTQAARDQGERAFDAVVIYQTSRLSRNRFYAGLYERDLRKVGVSIHYVVGGGPRPRREASRSASSS